MSNILDYISIDNIIEINKYECEVSNEPFEIINESLLYSLLESTNQEAFGIKMYSTIEDKISFVVTSILKNHFFKNGNKRTSLNVFGYLCNKYNLKYVTLDNYLADTILNLIEKPYNIEYTKEKLFIKIRREK